MKRARTETKQPKRCAAKLLTHEHNQGQEPNRAGHNADLDAALESHLGLGRTELRNRVSPCLYLGHLQRKKITRQFCENDTISKLYRVLRNKHAHKLSYVYANFHAHTHTFAHTLSELDIALHLTFLRSPYHFQVEKVACKI